LLNFVNKYFYKKCGVAAVRHATNYFNVSIAENAERVAVRNA
jgi:hypothetical protein